jgi:hypothetical protein
MLVVAVLDLTGLPSSETGFAIWPEVTPFGQLDPSRISVVNAEFTYNP